MFLPPKWTNVWKQNDVIQMSIRTYFFPKSVRMQKRKWEQRLEHFSFVFLVDDICYTQQQTLKSEE